jgi:hypothetical protein
MVEHTGSKWNPSIDDIEDRVDATVLTYRSAWAPNNPLLKRLHALTGWTMHNRFEEEQPEFEGEWYAEAGQVTAEYHSFYPRCSRCKRACRPDELNDDTACPSCEGDRTDYLVTVRPDVPGYREQPGGGDIEALGGEIVLGVFSGHDLREAYAMATWKLPKVFWKDRRLDEDPEAFGLRAYRLAREGG